MLKKQITYKNNLTGELVTEEHLFHLSKADIIELELAGDGLSEKLTKIVESQDNHAIYNEFKKIVLSAYGKRSEDGKRFIKSPAIRAEFEGSEAFSELVLELLQNEDAASNFVNAIMPVDMAPTPQTDLIGTLVSSEEIKEPIKTEPKVLNRDDIIGMDMDDIKSGLATGRYVLGN